MCRRAQAQVGDALPVARVVPCVAVGEGEVRYLVVLVARRLELGDEELKEAQACLLRHGLYLTALDKACERGAFLIDEVVGREVGDAEREEGADVREPSLLGLTRQAVDEIQAEIVDAMMA